MRTLAINKTKLWYVEIVGNEEDIDQDGNYSGDIIKTYTTPKQVELHLYPSNSDIIKQIFGTEDSFDMVSVSNEVVMSSGGLLFLNLPQETDDYESTYDYSIKSIAKSLNTYNYGLIRGTHG